MKLEPAKIAAIYIRVSNHKGTNQNSADNQKSHCFEKARMEGLEISPVHIYEEDKSTGTPILERESIIKLIEGAKMELFSTVIIPCLSRLSRDTREALTLKRILVNGLGIRLISIEEQYDSMVNDDELKFTLMSAAMQMGISLEEAANEMVKRLANRK